MKNVALLIVGIGVLLLGISAIVYVFRGPPKTPEQKYMEQQMEEYADVLEN